MSEFLGKEMIAAKLQASFVIGLDCDGPLSDFDRQWLEVFWEETGRVFGPEVLVTRSPSRSPFFAQVAEEVGRDPSELSSAIWRRVSAPGFVTLMKPIEGAREAVEAMRAYSTVEVLTKPLAGSPTWMPERVEWLRKHFGFKPDEIHFSARKERFAVDLFVDDSVEHLVAWEAAHPGRSAILWETHRNRKEALTGRFRHFARDWASGELLVRALRGGKHP